MVNSISKSTIVLALVLLLSAGSFLPLVMAQDNPGLPQATAKPSQITTDEKGKITLDLKGMDLVEVLKMLATKGNLNLIVGNDVKGRVTIFLKSVNIMDAFEIILVANDLAYDKRGDIIYVMSQKDYEALYGEKYADKKEAKIFQLKYAKAVEISKALNQIKTKLGKVVVDEGSNTVVVIDSPVAMSQMSATIEKVDIPTKTKIFELKYAKASDFKTKISESLTKGIGTMQIDERTNKISVTDLEKKLDDITEMVNAFDSQLQQVLIEAKIVQITLDDKFKLGVDWDSVLKKFSKEISIKSAFALTTPGALVPGAQVLVGALNTGSDYAAMVQILKEVGDTNLLSSPRITAINNQEAKILVGTSQPYATDTVTQGTSTTTTATNLTFIDIGVKLYVTPTINQDNFVSMKIRPEVSSSTSNYTYGSSTTTSGNTVPVVSTTQAETSVAVKDGTTIIIAGLVKDERTSTVSKIPLLGDIPIIGMAFRKTVNEIQKQELVIFLTPHIITGETDYIKNPNSPPAGEKRFTMPEPPTFERRDPVTMNSGIFKDKKIRPNEKIFKRKGAMPKVSKKAGEEEYYSVVKKMIVDNLELPRDKTKPIGKGDVKIAFFLSSDGKIVYGPEVLKSSNHALDGPAMNAVVNAAPFPAFPESLGKAERRLSIDIKTED